MKINALFLFGVFIKLILKIPDIAIHVFDILAKFANYVQRKKVTVIVIS